MADADHDLGPEPAGAAFAESSNRRALGSQPRQPLVQRLAIAALQREEGAASEAEPPVIVAGEQRDRRAAPLVDVGADQDQRALGPALHLAPDLRAAAP